MALTENRQDGETRDGVEALIPEAWELHRRRRTRRGAAGVLAGLVIIAGGYALLGGGSPPGRAGAVGVRGPLPAPMTPNPAALAAARSRCNYLASSSVGSNLSRPSSGTSVTVQFTRHRVLTVARGGNTALVAVNGDSVYSCLYSGTGIRTKAGVALKDIVIIQDFGPVAARPGADQITAPYGLVPYGTTTVGSSHAVPWAPLGSRPGEHAPRLARLSGRQQQAVRQLEQGGGYGAHVVGQAGSDVSAITFDFSNAPRVQATVENGWYFAWWPWESAPTSVRVTTSSGSLTSPMAGSWTSGRSAAPKCRPNATGCVFADT